MVESNSLIGHPIPLGKKRGGRKLALAPVGSPVSPRDAPQIQNATVKVLLRAFRWRKLLESGASATLGELALAEGIDPSYLDRALRLTLLAPDVVEALLDDRLPSEVGDRDYEADVDRVARAENYAITLFIIKSRPLNQCLSAGEKYR